MLEFQNPTEVIQLNNNKVWTPFERFSNLVDTTNNKNGDSRNQTNAPEYRRSQNQICQKSPTPLT
jgi:hypothetical protein